MQRAVGDQLEKLTGRRFPVISGGSGLLGMFGRGRLPDQVVPPPVEAISIIYKGTKQGDPMRAILVNSFVEHGSADFRKGILTTDMKGAPEEFTEDLLAVMVKEVDAMKEFARDNRTPSVWFDRR